jgi:hypothetical protein
MTPSRIERVQTHPMNPAQDDTMGLLFQPRKPLLRLATKAATASTAHHTSQHQTEPPPPAPATPPPQPDLMAELERLSRLHASGALTDQEFTAAKTRVLGI